MTRAQQRILWAMAVAASILFVFLLSLVLIGGGSRRDRVVRIQTVSATPSPLPVAARATLAPTPGSTAVGASPAPTRPIPTPSPSPTPSPVPALPPTPSPTATPTAPPPPRRSTPTSAVGLPDLVLQDFSVIAAGPGTGFVEVVIGNAGQADLTGQPVEIAGFDQTGTQVLNVTTGPVTIPIHGSLTIITGYKPAQRTMLTVVVNPRGTIREADAPPGFEDPNNALTKAITPP